MYKEEVEKGEMGRSREERWKEQGRIPTKQEHQERGYHGEGMRTESKGEEWD